MKPSYNTYSIFRVMEYFSYGDQTSMLYKLFKKGVIAMIGSEVVVGLHGFVTSGKIHSVMNLDTWGKEKGVR